ncbi:MAG: hypothetical protein K2Q18_00310 [Bdellovibrionales bacterium]|nr:hypothetical protein [Bdellovibrionales bacterium]
MQNSLIKILLLVCFIFLFTSCLRQSESITPLVPTQTLAQLQREAMMSAALNASNGSFSDNAQTSMTENLEDPSVFFLNLKYNIKELDVYETANVPNSFEKLSHSFLITFVKLFLRIKGSQTINLDPVKIDLPYMNLDFDVVKSIKIKRVFLEYNKDFDASVSLASSFSFINSFDVSRVGNDKSLLFSYKKNQNNCLYKCLDFIINNGDIFEILKANSESINIKPKLVIGSLPKVSDLILDGQIELQIGLRLPF